MISEKTISTGNVCYYSTLIDYAVELIATKCQNIDYTNNSDIPNYYIVPTKDAPGLSSQFSTIETIAYDFKDYAKFDKYTDDKLIFKSYITPKNPPSLVTVEKKTVEKELSDFLTSAGVLSKADAIMTTKSILNIFSYIAQFISSKVTVYKDTNGDLTYTYYNPNRVSFSYDVKQLVDDGTGGLSATDEYDSIDNMFKAFSNLDGINPNILIVKYSCSSSSSSCSCSCSSCSCSSSSCSCSSSSSSSYIVYMLID